MQLALAMLMAHTMRQSRVHAGIIAQFEALVQSAGTTWFTVAEWHRCLHAPEECTLARLQCLLCSCDCLGDLDMSVWVPYEVSGQIVAFEPTGSVAFEPRGSDSALPQ